MGPIDLRALELARDLPPTAGNIRRVAAQTSDEAARWAFTQWELRRRGAEKFDRASEMLFDREGLEMASSRLASRWHDARFPPGVRVADLTCGIGGDLIALSEGRPALGYEVDPVRAEMARHNLGVFDRDAEVRVENCLAAAWDFEYAFADPARRSGGKRTLDIAAFQPALAPLMARMRDLRLGLVKLSPMLSDETLRELGGWIQFVTVGRECREALVSVGSEATSGNDVCAGSVCAVHLESGRLLSQSPADGAVHRDEPADYLLEADPAAIRSNALPSLCVESGYALLGDSNGYLTGESLSADADVRDWVHPFRVLSHGRADEKAIRADLKKLDARVSVVKGRGHRVDPAKWLRALKSPGPLDLVLVLFPVGKSLRYALCSPVGDSGKNT